VEEFILLASEVFGKLILEWVGTLPRVQEFL